MDTLPTEMIVELIKYLGLCNSLAFVSVAKKFIDLRKLVILSFVTRSVVHGTNILTTDSISDNLKAQIFRLAPNTVQLKFSIDGYITDFVDAKLFHIENKNYHPVNEVQFNDLVKISDTVNNITSCAGVLITIKTNGDVIIKGYVFQKRIVIDISIIYRCAKIPKFARACINKLFNEDD